MAGCEAKLNRRGKGAGKPLQLRVCGMRAIVKTPKGFFAHGREVWFCAEHAPTKLLPRGMGPNVEFSGRTRSAGAQG